MVQAFDGIIGPEAPPGKKWGIIIVAVVLLLFFLVVLPVVLTLPETYSCYPEDGAYFVKILPNTSIGTVDPSFLCLADSPVSISVDGSYFLRQRGYDDDGNEIDLESMHFYYAYESMTSASANDPAIANQGRYTLMTDSNTDAVTAVIGNPFSIWLHEKNETSLTPIVSSVTREITVTWDEASCSDMVTQVGARYLGSDQPDQMELTFYSNTTLRKQPLRECTRFQVTLPQHSALTQHVVPELFVSQPVGPQPHPVALPSTRAVPGKPTCQHSTFGELVLFPRPRVFRLDPPFVCETASTVLTFTGDYLLRHRRQTTDALQKPLLVSDSAFTVPFSNLSMSNCDAVVVDRYASVEECAQMDVSFASSDIGTPASSHTWALTNPSPADCSTDATDAARQFYIAPRPTLPSSGLEWPLWCSDRALTTIVMGTGFLLADGLQPQVSFNGTLLPRADTLFGSCTPVAADDPPHNLTACTSYNITFTPTLSASQGTADTIAMEIELPFQERTTPPCHTSVPVGVIEQMTHTQSIPDGAYCGSTPVTQLILVGTFWTINDETPVVVVDGSVPTATVTAPIATCGPERLINSQRLRQCTELRIVTSTLDLKGNHTYTFSHPLLSCPVTSNVLTDPILAPMQLTQVDPWNQQRCGAAAATTVQLTGLFYRIDSVPFQVTVDGAAPSSATLRACRFGYTFNRLNVEECTEILVSASTDMTGSRTWGLQTSTLCFLNSTLTTSNGLAATTITSVVTTGPVCDGGSSFPVVTVIVNGIFHAFDDVDPTLSVDGINPMSITRTNCGSLNSTFGVTVRTCSQYQITMMSLNLLGSHTYAVSSNPLCQTLGIPVTTSPPLPPMNLTAVNPREDCFFLPNLLSAQLVGSFFIFDSDPLQVRVNNILVPAFPETCTPPEPLGLGLTVQRCSTLYVNQSTTDLKDGPNTWAITASPQCGLSPTPIVTAPLRIPNITEAPQPNFMCFDRTETLTFTGVNFAPDGIAPTIELVERDLGTSYPASSVLSFNDTSVTVQFLNGTVPAGKYRIRLVNSLRCEFLSPQMEEFRSIIVSFVLVVYADPPNIFSGANTAITVLTSGLLFPPVRLSLFQGNNFVLELNVTRVFTNNKFQGLVPRGTLLAGRYDIEVQGTYCTSYLRSALNIINTTDYALQAVVPAFVWQQSDSPVEVSVTPTTLVALPTVYLSPSNGGPGDVATPLLGLQLRDAGRLTAVIPAATNNLTVGLYDLLIINPTLEVGFFPGAITVIADEPPILTAVAPNWLPNNGPALGSSLFGRNLEVNGSVTRDCYSYATTLTSAFPDNLFATVADTLVSASGDGTRITVDFQLPVTPPPDYFCVINYRRNRDGATARFSGLPVHSPSGNTLNFRSTNRPLVGARYAHSVASYATPVERTVYVMGGKNTSTTLRDVQFSTVDVLGQLSTWNVLPQRLPVARQFSCAAAIDKFIYLIGGSNETDDQPQSTVYRAQVLDPLDVPVFADIDLSVNISEAPNFVASTYYYRVSAIFNSSYMRNPSGETLPSETLALNLPSVAGLKVKITWEPITGASGYRVYRSQNPGDSPSSVVLLTTVTELFFQDDNSRTFTSGAVPLTIGRLGNWHELTSSPYPTPIYRHGCVAVPSRVTPNTFHLYGVGGATALGAVTGAINYATVTVQPASKGDSQNQLMSTFSFAGSLLYPRADLSASFANSLNNRAFNGDPTASVLYVGGGSTVFTGLVPNSVGNSVDFCNITDGTITGVCMPLNGSPGPGSAVYGYSSFVGGDYYAQSGGSTANPGDKTAGAQFNAANGDTASAWNSVASGTLLFPSRFHAGVSSNGFVIITGGLDSVGTPRAETQTVYI